MTTEIEAGESKSVPVTSSSDGIHYQPLASPNPWHEIQRIDPPGWVVYNSEIAAAGFSFNYSFNYALAPALIGTPDDAAPGEYEARFFQNAFVFTSIDPETGATGYAGFGHKSRFRFIITDTDTDTISAVADGDAVGYVAVKSGDDLLVKEYIEGQASEETVYTLAGYDNPSLYRTPNCTRFFLSAREKSSNEQKTFISDDHCRTFTEAV